MRPIWNTKSISVVCQVIYAHLPLDSGCQLQIVIMVSSIIYFKLLLLIKMWSGFLVSTVTFLFYWSTRQSAMVCKAVSLIKWRNGVELCYICPTLSPRAESLFGQPPGTSITQALYNLYTRKKKKTITHRVFATNIQKTPK